MASRLTRAPPGEEVALGQQARAEAVRAQEVPLTPVMQIAPTAQQELVGGRSEQQT